MTRPGTNTQPNVPDQLTLDSSPAICVMKPLSPAAHAKPLSPPNTTSVAAEVPFFIRLSCLSGQP